MGNFVRRMTESVREVSAIVNRDGNTIQRALDGALIPLELSDDNRNKYAAFLSLTGDFSKNPYRRKKKAMDETFRVSDPKDKTKGDFVSFMVSDGNQTVPGRISRTALALLRGPKDDDDLTTFDTHKERIRAAAFHMRRMNPSLDLIALGSNNFD
jgi:hypothetical protein